MQRRNSSESEKADSSISSRRRNSSSLEPETMVIRRAEWDALQAELDKMRAVLGLGLDVDVVGSEQFKQLQSQLQEWRGKAEKQMQREEKFKSQWQVMEQQWNQRAEEHQVQTSELKSQVCQSQTLLKQLQSSYKIAFEEVF